MVDTVAPESSARGASRGLLTRAIGVFFSPRATYADVAARPRAAGALAASTAMAALATFLFLSTDVGQTALIDAQISRMESLGRQLTDAQIANLQRFAPLFKYFGSGSIVLLSAGLAVVLSGVAIAVFNAGLGGTATFRQVFAIVAHSFFIPALREVFVLPLNYATQTMSSSTSLAVFFPMLDDTAFLARLLQQIDLFRVWWLVSLAIGLGVLYKRKTVPIAWSLLCLYGVIAFITAGVIAALSGA